MVSALHDPTVSVTFVPPRNTRMRRVLDRARQLARGPAPLLLRGEMGVGKRTLATLMHCWGPHPEGPCVFIRAAEEPQGVWRAAFERLRQAHGAGTLVLEEPLECTPAQQDEVLALLQPHGADQAEVVGAQDGRPPALGIKIIATTSQDLSVAIRQGHLAQQLCAVLTGESLYLPPLRERPEDISVLSETWLTHFAGLYRRPHVAFGADAKAALVRYVWPGNLPELRNAIEHAVLTAPRDQITRADLPLRLSPDHAGDGMPSDPLLSLDAMEKRHILQVMRATPTLEEAARTLRVDITTLWRKRRRYGI